MEERSHDESVPFGLLFSTFMVFIMIGSLSFKTLAAAGVATSKICLLAFSCGAISFLIPSVFTVLLFN